MPLIYQKWIMREDLRANPHVFYVFGDNLQRRGFKGQAAQMRGEPNAIGVPTKYRPSMAPEALFYDHTEEAGLHISLGFNQVSLQLNKGKLVVWPLDGIGTGLSKIPENAPKLWEWMEEKRLHFEQL